MKYKQSKMVNWFRPSILIQTGLKSVISSLFGNYADRREMQAALDIPTTGSIDNKELPEYIATPEGIWIDFISDTGDGFNPTFSIASTAARPQLTVEDKGIKTILPRAKILIMGGDQIYPTPTREVYEQKFKVPFEAAAIEKGDNENSQHMYAIPGNHDWYDGLGSFMKVFCQQRQIGIWQTMQTRSYFALKLPYNYWIWATDIQLNGDIDKPQLDYFEEVAKKKMQAGDKVILCTAEPAWIYKQLYRKDTSYAKFRFFIETYITNVNYGFKVAVVLTGDLHHYSHYCFKDKEEESNHYIGAGGGGAFLHLTHNLPKVLDKLNENESTPPKVITLQKTFPEKEDSRRLLLGNLAFPIKNSYFSMLLGGIYLLFYWLLHSRFGGGNFLKYLNDLSFGEYLCETGMILLYTPFLSLISLLLIVGFYRLTDIKTRRRFIWLWGLMHGLLQCGLIYLVIWGIAKIPHESIDSTTWKFIFIPALWITGWLLGGFIMGLYLLISNLLGTHLDESSSSLASQHYKNFLRMSINQEGLTIYSIGIKKVTTKWTQKGEGENLCFTGKMPQYHLIEKISIKK